MKISARCPVCNAINDSLEYYDNGELIEKHYVCTRCGYIEELDGFTFSDRNAWYLKNQERNASKIKQMKKDRRYIPYEEW